ncbi:uncharacterized protein LOC132729669 [Ruditapes philippinarum]|uniref:uncharacterized protein LOC132729669 n=1 Tax=Ruditapes philippinarum TaxID=129788 RepID=UPI00295A67F6|nr:uncharacterized protein LOC132729669 [Ruditapes philippinarum]
MAASIIRTMFLRCQAAVRSNALTLQTVRKLETSLVCRSFTCQSVLWNDKCVEAPELKKLVDNLTYKFSEARELLTDARESQDTVYFSEDLEDAQKAVEETLTEYRQLLDKLTDQQRQEIISTIGLRMEELKAQQRAIEDHLKDHH